MEDALDTKARDEIAKQGPNPREVKAMWLLWLSVKRGINDQGKYTLMTLIFLSQRNLYLNQWNGKECKEYLS